MKNYLIAGNWKMNKTKAETLEFCEALRSQDFNAKSLAIIAPYLDLDILSKNLAPLGVRIGAENVHYEPSGAYTGEISVPMLEEAGIELCLVGHSERRQYFAETDASCNLKLKALLASSITPILCVGEPLCEREAGTDSLYVGRQINDCLDGIPEEDIRNLIIAYEPIWAIGTGNTATKEQADDMCAFIRGVIAGLYANDIADNMLILYGGSMKESNARELLSMPNINGGLIGGASLQPDSLLSILNSIDTRGE